MIALQPTFRSSVNTWQCDENDHLNVQFYTAFGDDASIQWLSLNGLGPQAQARAGLRVQPVSDRIRYWKELRGQDSLEIHSAPVEVEPGRIALYHELRNSYDGDIAAVMVRDVECRDAAGRAVPFPTALSDRAGAARMALPDAGKSRSIGRFGHPPELTLQQAQDMGMIEINRAVVAPEECDAFGRLRPRFHFSRFSDGAAILWHRMGFDRVAMRQRQQGSVVLETRTLYRRPIPVGTPTVVLSGLLDVSDKVLHFAHLLFDAETGTLCASGEAVGIQFDQQTRRSMALRAEDRERLGGRVVKGLGSGT